jgi:hypothetical protein
MGCPYRDHCRDDCEECTEEKRQDKLAELIDQAMLREEVR